MSWLARLKNLQTPEGHATKPTKPGFVGFVARPLGVSENSGVVEVPLRLREVGPANVAPVTDRHHVVVARTCADCQHLGPRGTCFEPVAAGLRTEQEGFGIARPDEDYAAACPGGKGNADKAAMLAAARAAGQNPVDDNEADAIALLRFVASKK